MWRGGRGHANVSNTSQLVLYSRQPTTTSPVALHQPECVEFRCGGFRNLHPKNSRLTSMEWINEVQESLLLTASDDGVVRIRAGLLQAATCDPENMTPPRLVSAFHAAPVSVLQLFMGEAVVS